MKCAYLWHRASFDSRTFPTYTSFCNIFIFNFHAFIFGLEPSFESYIVSFELSLALKSLVSYPLAFLSRLRVSMACRELPTFWRSPHSRGRTKVELPHVFWWHGFYGSGTAWVLCHCDGSMTHEFSDHTDESEIGFARGTWSKSGDTLTIVFDEFRGTVNGKEVIPWTKCETSDLWSIPTKFETSGRLFEGGLPGVFARKNYDKNIDEISVRMWTRYGTGDDYFHGN